GNVTGVQTCALPICTAAIRGVIANAHRMSEVGGTVTAMPTATVDQAPATQAVLHQVLAGLHVSLLDVAETAHVQRPVVSVWRRRYAGGPDPFPSPVRQRGQQPLVSAAEAATRAQRNRRGNNPELAIDLPHAPFSPGAAGTQAVPTRSPARCASAASSRCSPPRRWPPGCSATAGATTPSSPSTWPCARSPMTTAPRTSPCCPL